MNIELICGLIVFLVILSIDIKTTRNFELENNFKSIEKIDAYLDNVILKKYENKKKNKHTKKCPISENIINIEKEINRLNLKMR